MTGALILASGTGADGEKLDPMRQVGTISAVLQLILTMFRARVPLVAVAAAREEVPAIQKHIARMGAVCLAGEGASAHELLQEGAAFLEKDCDRIVIASVEYPGIASETVQLLAESGEVCTYPVCQSQEGLPAVISHEGYPRLLRCLDREEKEIPPAAGHIAEVLGLLRRAGLAMTPVPTEDTGAVRALPGGESGRSLNPLRFCAGIRLARDTVFFGPGAAQLLELIEREASVRMASERMGISYTKAWKMLKKMEDGAGFPAAVCQQGGKSGGQAHLTPEAKELLRKYRSFEQRANDCLQGLFEEVFADGGAKEHKTEEEP